MSKEGAAELGSLVTACCKGDTEPSPSYYVKLQSLDL